MKQLLFTLLLLPFLAKAQTTASCCTQDATTEFAAFASQEDFRMMHPDPLPYHYTGVIGEPVTFSTPDGATGYGFQFKAKAPTKQYLLVFHEWYGLNDYVKKEAEKLYNDLGSKVNVIAIDLYDQKVATNREDAAKYIQSVKTERAQAIIRGAFTMIGTDAKIGTIGWCFGGGWSLQASILAGRQAIACVMYYGMPEKDVNVLSTLNAPVLGLFAKKDKNITPEVVAAFEQNMRVAKRTVRTKEYEAEHGFANPSNPNYDSEATRDAYKETLIFLKERFGN
jgi:carboxymethylenebutenolidase